MKVIRTFYTHKDKKTYKVGDNYIGVKFKGWELYLEGKKNKKSPITKKGKLETK